MKPPPQKTLPQDIGKQLRPNTRLIASDDVWLEGEAIRQLEQIAAEPDCMVACGMPDLHPGPGIPIGAAFAFSETIHPRLVGSDAGCGALIVSLDKVKLSSSLERRLRAEFSEDHLDEIDLPALCHSVWNHGPQGLKGFDLGGIVDSLSDTLSTDTLGKSGSLISDCFGASLGTIGGGNHFAEIGRVTKVIDKDAAKQIGLKSGSLVLLCHSGSRGLGKSLADAWGHTPLNSSQAGDYLAQLAGAVRYARANRILLAARLLRALGVSRPNKIASAFDVVHNSVDCETCGDQKLWIHRKGCAPAHRDQLAVVLGSRGAPSWIMNGHGNPNGLSSIAHGAGRKMKRSEAREKIRARYHRKQLSKSALGGMAICDDNKLLYEEHPDAYKDIEPVISSLEQADLASRVVAIEPIFTVKK